MSNAVNIDTVGIENFYNVKYISNKNYFIANPLHAVHDESYNSNGTCTTVAMQLLLGYHNYYTDRRLIPQTDGEDLIFLESNYGDILEYPSIDNSLSSGTGRSSLGTSDSVYHELFRLNSMGSLPGLGQSIGLVKNAAKKFVEEHSDFDSDNFNIESGIYSKNSAINELNNGRPIILGFNKLFENGDNNFHVVVAYGYAKYNEEDGYIVHFGWGDNKNHAWVPENWIGYQIKINIEHTHTYIDSGEMVNRIYKKFICNECQCETLNCIYKTNEEGNSIVGTNFLLSSNVTIPNEIFLVKINSISNGAFKNNNEIKTVFIPSYINSIGLNAFENCGNLEKINIGANINDISRETFKNCINLNSVEIGSSVLTIGPNAFENCVSLNKIIIPKNIIQIDENAFSNCNNLSNVIILNDSHNITMLGKNAFSGCSQNLKIQIPKRRYIDYCTAINWNDYGSNIVTDVEFEEINLDCISNGEKNILLDNGENDLLMLNVCCAKTYKFKSNSNILFKIYNLSKNKIYDGSQVLDAYLNPGVYFLDVRYHNFDESGSFVINYELNFPINGTLVYNNMVNEINSCFHTTTNNLKHALLIFENADGEGMYRFKLNAGNDDLYPEGSVRICSDIERNSPLYRYGMSDVSIYAETFINENELNVYLPKGGCYYIEVKLYNNTYSNVTFEISNVETNNIDYLDYFNDISFDVLFEAKKVENYFEEVVINQRSKVQLDIISESILTDCVPVFIFEKILEPGYDIGDEYFYLEPSFIGEITPDYWAPVYTIILDPGTYYFGYHNNFDNAKINFALRRIVDYNENAENILVSDPYYEGYELGSEVNFNNGECDSYTITEGFTRNIYLMVEDRLRDPMSRLDYDWYSSNENIAIVTKYGTVLAMPVDIDTTVTIYAALKTDPSIVYYKTFTILNDIEEELIEIECEMIYSISNDTPLYKLELDSTNCPFPMVQYYSWTLFNESDETVNIDKWGYVTSSGPTEVLVVGTYNLNPRVKIFIHLVVTE